MGLGNFYIGDMDDIIESDENDNSSIYIQSVQD